MNIWDALLTGLGQLLAGLYDLVPNYGVAIVLLTVIVRVALLPLTIKQTRSMQALQKLQPEIKKLQAKYPNREDRAKLNEEMMALYRQEGANPMGGCLPLVLQLPVFFALYRVLTGRLAGCAAKTAAAAGRCTPGLKHLPAGAALYGAIEAGKETFLGMNLALTPNQALGANGVWGALPYFVLVALMGATGWIQQRQMSGMQAGGQQAAQAQMIGKVMPIMFTFFSLSFPAGVTVYWVMSNIWTIGQQYFLVGRKAREAGVSGGNGATGSVGGGAMGRPKAPGADGSSLPGEPGRPKGSGARRRKGKGRR